MKLPIGIAVVLAITKFLDCLGYFGILGYLPQVLTKFEVDKSDIGTYEGTITFINMAGRILGTFGYGPALDRWNSVSVLAFIQFTTCLSTLGFGLSTNPICLAVFRFCFGVTNGIDINLRVIIREVQVDSYDIAILYALPISLALSIGPSLGGLLALPVQQYPSVFGGNKVLDEMPVLLPNLILALFYFSNGIAAVFYLSKKINQLKDTGISESTPLLLSSRNVNGISENAISDNGNVGENEHQKNLSTKIASQSSPGNTKAYFRKLLTRDFCLSCITMILYWCGTTAFYVVFALWLGTPESIGGIGFTPAETTNIYLVPGLVAMCLDFLVLGRVNASLNPRCAFVIWVFLKSFLVLVVTYFGVVKARLPFTIAVGFVIAFVRFATSGCNSTLVHVVNNTVPQEVVGVANAVAISTSSLASTISSILLGKLYSWSVNNELTANGQYMTFPFNHYFTFYVSGLLTIGSAVSCAFIRK